MPHVYGWQHIVYLLIFFGVCAGALAAVLLKVKTAKTIDLIVKCLGGALLVLIILNRIFICMHKDYNWWLLIPDSFCGLSSLCLAICALVCKRDALPLHCLCYISFWGGMIVTFYPDFLGQASYFMYPATITGLLHHGLAAFISVFMIVTGFMKPSLKKFYAFPCGLSFMTVYGLFLLDGLHFKEAMFIGKPLIPNSFLTWYVIAVVLIVGTLGLVWLYEYLIKRYNAKRQIKAIEEVEEIDEAAATDAEN